MKPVNVVILLIGLMVTPLWAEPFNSSRSCVALLISMNRNSDLEIHQKHLEKFGIDVTHFQSTLQEFVSSPESFVSKYVDSKNMQFNEMAVAKIKASFEQMNESLREDLSNQESHRARIVELTKVIDNEQGRYSEDEIQQAMLSLEVIDEPFIVAEAERVVNIIADALNSESTNRSIMESIGMVSNRVNAQRKSSEEHYFNQYLLYFLGQSEDNFGLLIADLYLNYPRQFLRVFSSWGDIDNFAEHYVSERAQSNAELDRLQILVNRLEVERMSLLTRLNNMEWSAGLGTFIAISAFLAMITMN